MLHDYENAIQKYVDFVLRRPSLNSKNELIELFRFYYETWNFCHYILATATI